MSNVGKESIKTGSLERILVVKNRSTSPAGELKNISRVYDIAKRPNDDIVLLNDSSVYTLDWNLNNRPNETLALNTLVGGKKAICIGVTDDKLILGYSDSKCFMVYDSEGKVQQSFGMPTARHEDFMKDIEYAPMQVEISNNNLFLLSVAGPNMEKGVDDMVLNIISEEVTERECVVRRDDEDNLVLAEFRRTKSEDEEIREHIAAITTDFKGGLFLLLKDNKDDTKYTIAMYDGRNSKLQCVDQFATTSMLSFAYNPKNEGFYLCPGLSKICQVKEGKLNPIRVSDKGNSISRFSSLYIDQHGKFYFSAKDCPVMSAVLQSRKSERLKRPA